MFKWEHYAYSPTPPIFMKFSAFVVFLMLITKMKTVFGAKAPFVRYGVPKFQKIAYGHGVPRFGI